MKILLSMTILQFKMLLRNKTLLLSSLGLAVVSMLIFGTLFGGNNTEPLAMGVVDLDNSPLSQQVVAALKQNSSLKVTSSDQATLLEQLKNNQQSALIVLESGFGANLPKGQAQVQFYVDQNDLIGAERSRVVVSSIFDTISKQTAGFKDLVQVSEQQVSARRQRQIDVLTPGMLGMTIMFANMYVGLALINWRLRGTLKRLNATPLKAWQLIGSQVLSQFVLSFMQVVIIMVLAITIFNVQLKLEWLPAMVLFTVAGAFSVISLGYAIGNFVQKPESAQSTATLIALPMMFLGGSYFQVNPPVFLQPLVEVLPLTHLNHAFRQIMLNGATIDKLLVDLVALLASGTLLLILSVRTFSWSK
jgi:ABC-2 type transport system permease protein